MTDKSLPLISIGMPIYNACETLRPTLDSILSQTFGNLEIIISDNCSTDNTQELCLIYAERDPRIKYFRQDLNIGPMANFEFVLNAARGKYFMWAASDDRRSPDFIDTNYQFLESNSDYAASTSPDIFDFEFERGDSPTTTNVVGTKDERMRIFFEICKRSNGLFYSLIRLEIIQNCTTLRELVLNRKIDTRFGIQPIFAWDWLILIHLIQHGSINRSQKGLAIFGSGGLSNTRNMYSRLGLFGIRRVFPFLIFNSFFIDSIKGSSRKQKLLLFILLARLNFMNLIHNFREIRYFMSLLRNKCSRYSKD